VFKDKGTSTCPGKSCPSVCMNGPISHDQWDLEYVERRAGRTNETAPKAGAVSKFNRSVPQAATLTSRSLLELAIGIDRGFMASGTSRTSSTCRSPFSWLAPLTLT
jgi:hypothetical protein